MQQTKIYFPLIFISLEDDSSIVIPPQPTSPGEIMSGGDGEPVEADAPAKDETVADLAKAIKVEMVEDAAPEKKTVRTVKKAEEASAE